MIAGAVLGIISFVFLVLYERCICKRINENREIKNPWFTAGIVLLTAGWLTAFFCSPKAPGLQCAAGTALAVAAAVVYKKLLGLTAGKSGDEKNTGKKVPLVDSGAYAKNRHPGIWCFALIAACLTLAAPKMWLINLLFTVLNIVYCVLQDRIYFPAYIEGYEEYKKRVPFC